MQFSDGCDFNYFNAGNWYFTNAVIFVFIFRLNIFGVFTIILKDLTNSASLLNITCLKKALHPHGKMHKINWEGSGWSG